MVSNIALCNPKPIAKAVWLAELKKEVKSYAKSGDCVLKITSPAVVSYFSNGSFIEQFQERCPRLCLVLANIANTGKAKLYTREDILSLSHRAMNSICLASASCLKQYNQKLSAAHYRMSLLLLNGGAKAITIYRCSQLGHTVSHTSAIRSSICAMCVLERGHPPQGTAI